MTGDKIKNVKVELHCGIGFCHFLQVVDLGLHLYLGCELRLQKVGDHCARQLANRKPSSKYLISLR